MRGNLTAAANAFKICPMYRVFECLDELNRTVEHGRSVPMTSNCVVPRNEVLAILDDLRNALPVEVDDAQDVLDKQDEIIRGAEERADQTIADSSAQADEIMARAEADAAAMVEDATRRAEAIMAKAHADSTAMVEDAQAQAERTIAEGNASYERAVADGQAEQERLVSESEVVRRSNEEAHRIVDTAHTESNRLRTECDEFVDSKLAEFEETLGGLLRTVSSDRTALRRGAGAASGVPRHRPERGGYTPRGYEQ